MKKLIQFIICSFIFFFPLLMLGQVQDLSECSDTPTATFFLPDAYSGSDQVSFHSTQSDAASAINPLISSFTSGTATLFARIENISTGTFDVESFDLIVFPNPNAASTTTEICSDSSTASIDLTGLNDTITDETDVTITFYEVLTDAHSGINEITNSSNYTTSTAIIFARVESNLTGCFSVVEATLDIFINPDTNDVPIELITCSPNATANFDLTSLIPDINDQPSTVTITFHETQNDAETGDNEIGDPTTYSSDSATVFARVLDTNTGCHNIGEIELIVNQEPLANNAMLEEQSSTSMATFTLSDADMDVSNETDITITYHETEADAETSSNALPNTFTTESTIIFARVENNTTSCTSISEVTLNVVSDEISPITDDLSINTCRVDGIATFDLGSYAAELNTEFPEFEFSFYANEADATNDESELLDNFQSEGETIYTRYENSDMQFLVTSVELIVTETPTEQQEVTICEGEVYVLPDGEEVTAAGTYQSTIISNGCDLIVETTLSLESISFPSAFAPNGNGSNEYFRPAPTQCLTNVSEYELKVFEGAGQLVYESFSVNDIGWDGTYDGEPMPAETYLYTCTYKIGENETQLSGTFLLIR